MCGGFREFADGCAASCSLFLFNQSLRGIGRESNFSKGMCMYVDKVWWISRICGRVHCVVLVVFVFNQSLWEYCSFPTETLETITLATEV